MLNTVINKAHTGIFKAHAGKYYYCYKTSTCSE